MGPVQNYVSVSRRPPDVEDYIDILRRYRSWIIGPMFAGLVVAVVVAFWWPDTYVSEAMMRITPPQIPERLVPNSISTQLAQRLTQMQTEIESRSSLSELIQRPSLDLYKKKRQREPLEDVVDAMRKDISIQMINVPSASSPDRTMASAFRIQFKYTDRYKAQAVVNELVTKFMEQNINVQRKQSTATAAFLGDQLKDAKERLDNLDAQITKFKEENNGRLPEQLQANVQALNSLELRLGATNEALNRSQEEKMMLQTQLQNLNNQANYVANAAPEPTAGAESMRNDRLTQLNNDITTLETQLAAARQIYQDSHPDIKALESKLRVLQSERDRVQQSQLAAAKSAAAGAHKTVNPEVAKSLEDIKSNIALVQSQIKAKDLDIAERTKQQEAFTKAIQGYQARIEVSPVSEQRYAALQRDYDLAKANYDDMAKRHEISQTAQDLEEQKGGENLEVLDPASLPEQPSEPNRLAIAGLGTAGGLMLGLLLAGAKEMKNTSLKNLKDVRAYTNLPVLSSIPLLENALLVRRKRRLFWLAWSSAIIIGTIAMSGSMYYYYFGRT